MARKTTDKLADRLQAEFNANRDNHDGRLVPMESKFTAAEMRAVIAALRYVLLAPGYTR